MEPNKVEGLENYEIECWIDQLGSAPIRVVKKSCCCESFQTDHIYVLELENGKYATVVEAGCSCYDSNDAEIEIHPSKESALAKFDQWGKEQN